MLETPARIEPCFFGEHIPAVLADLSVDIQREATGLDKGYMLTAQPSLPFSSA
ncbi:hypothetical protein SAMN06295998_1379 [Primorskyibacter flagellatus]|uniref:Uncharacterized protein n=1 Tax=Primorskyibacter flagellatus TaxID=1387277 RepID=A0A1W2EQG3_9RHOB|nr:hypothetical protein SAMN06295998_1379 [Primorskyibacter flagellatus]